MHGIQAWVGLPKELEECEPAFEHYGSGDLPTFEPGGLWARLIAGEAFGVKAAVRTHPPMFYVHWRLAAGERAQLDAQYPERAAYIATGSLQVQGRTFEAGKMLIFERGQPIVITAVTPAVVMLLGGEPIGERFIEWNFVSSSRKRIEQAKADWQAGRMKLPVHDGAEFVPLPPDTA